MEIKERIVKIISSEGLNSSAFADMIGVQRSSISHILSGRNKPSLDLLQKILKTFNKYNADWLITGDGEIYKQPKQSSIFDTPGVAGSNNEANNFKHEHTLTKHNKEDNRETDEILNYNTTNKIPNSGKQDKEVTKIVIFYSDATFNEFKPN